MNYEALSIYFEIPPTDALGKEHVTGKVLSTDEGLSLHHKIKKRTFSGEGEEHEITFTYEDVEAIDINKRLFRSPELTLQFAQPEKVSGVPSADHGRITVEISKNSLDDAKSLVKRLEFKRAEKEADRTRERMNDLG